MSYANGTQFYNLPQTVGTDKRDWFDTNTAFAAIDAALHVAASGQAADAEAIATINGKLLDDEAAITSLQGSVSTHATQIATLANSVNQLNTEVADVRSDAEDMITAYNEGAASTSTRVYAVGDYFIYNDVLYKATQVISIGDTIVPNTNCTATNVMTEVDQINTEVDQINEALTTGTISSIVVSTIDSWIDTNIHIDFNGLYTIEYMANSNVIYQQIIMGATLQGSSAASAISLLGYHTQVDNVLVCENSDNELQLYVSTEVGAGALYVQKILEVH